MNTNPSHSRRRRRTVLAALVASSLVTIVVPQVAAPSPVGAAPPAACGPLGKLVSYALNDRCDYGTGQDPDKVDSFAVVDGLRGAGLFSANVECGDGSVVPVAAVPDQLLVTATNSGQLNEALAKLQAMLGSSFIGSVKLNGLAAVIKLRPGILDVAFLTGVIPKLQSTDWSTDLNYLEQALPNNSFRPADNPLTASAASSTSGGKGSVLVLDSPAEARRYPVAADVVISTFGPAAVYDVDANKFIDEDHGHGVFVASLIKRFAPGADVVLYGVNGGQLPGSGRWSPMMFSDADLITSMGAAFGLSSSGTATNRSYNVVNMSLGGAGCAGVAVRLGLGRFMRDLANAAAVRGARPKYVAAAGNDGGDVKHFPAAFRDKDTMETAAKAIDKAEGVQPSAAGNAVRKLSADLAVSTVAVGSWTAGVRDAFSNCGSWVNATADGAGAVSRYPSSSGWASWSGTSFATPQVAAAMVNGTTSGVTIQSGIGAC